MIDFVLGTLTGAQKKLQTKVKMGTKDEILSALDQWKSELKENDSVKSDKRKPPVSIEDMIRSCNENGNSDGDDNAEEEDDDDDKPIAKGKRGAAAKKAPAKPRAKAASKVKTVKATPVKKSTDRSKKVRLCSLS